MILMMAAALTCGCSEEKAKESLHSVMTTTPQGAANETVKNFSGVVKENAETSLGFKTSGQIEQVMVREGDRVRRGQIIARLDAKDYQLGVDALQIQYDQLSAEVERLRLLYEGKSLAGNDYEKAVSGLRQLGVQLQAEKNKLSYTRLCAPEDGVVQKIHHERAEMVGAGTPVVTLLDLHRMEVEISLPQNIYSQRDRFGRIYCTAAGRQYELHCRSIIPKADNNQLYTATFSVDGQLTAGQTVDVVISLKGEGAAGQYTVPLHAVFENDGKSYVWIVSKDSTVGRREVTTVGTDAEGHLIINSGLTGRETIVRAGVNALNEGERVKIIAENSDTNVGGLI